MTADREAEDAAGCSVSGSHALAPDAVVDMLCFTPESARQLVDALRPTRPLLVHCGTIWVHGPAARVPVTEDEPRTAFGEYGIGKAAIETSAAARDGRRRECRAWCCIPDTSAGPWPSITPAGNLDLDVWRQLGRR